MHAESEKVSPISRRITVFTPTYNRRKLLERLYASLQKQSFRDFEWLVVDDGSRDDTAQWFAALQRQETPFEIRYIRTENGGKHRAINRGVREARGALFYIVDSDDYVAENALQRIHDIENTIPREQKASFAGICGTKCYENGQIIGTAPQQEQMDVTSLQWLQLGLRGDKAEVYYTEVLRRYPFPTFEGEKFLTECVVWDRIAADGLKLRCRQEPLMVCEYQEDGLSANAVRLFHSNPRGYGLYLSQSAANGRLKGKEKWDGYLDLYYGVRDRYSFREISGMLGKNPLLLWSSLLLIRLYNKLFDR